MALYKRLRDLREDSDKTQTEIAAFLGTTAQYYGKYEKGECELPFIRAIQLASYYGVSLDYIAERTNFEQGTANPKFSDEELRIIEMYSRLSEKTRENSKCFLKCLLKHKTNKADFSNFYSCYLI